MTVSELITQLKQLDQDLNVCNIDETEVGFFRIQEIINVSEITTSTGDRLVVFDFCNYLSQPEENKN